MRARITEKTLSRKVPATGQEEVWDTILRGFGIRFSYGGKRTFFVMTRINGRQVRRTVGTTDTHTLAEARDEARAIFGAALKGVDSASRKAKREEAARRTREAERAQKNSFRSVAEAYLADKNKGGGGRLRTNRALGLRLERKIFPRWGDRPITDITPDDVRDLIDDIMATNPITANRTLALLRRVFKWAVLKRKLAISPALGIEPPSEESSRERTLSDAEIALLWGAFDKLGHPFSPTLKLLLLTGQRRGEVSGMRWSELEEEGTWIIPSERTKNGRPHIVPLSPLAQQILAGVPRVDGAEHVFTTGRSRTRTADGTRVTDRPISGWGKMKLRIDKLAAEAVAKAAGQKLNMKKHALAQWWLHDLRRTMVTRMHEQLGVEPHVVEAVVNHVSGLAKSGVAGVYNRATYLPQRRAALTAWSQYVASLVRLPSAAPSNVASLDERRRGAAA